MKRLTKGLTLRALRARNFCDFSYFYRVFKFFFNEIEMFFYARGARRAN